MNASLGAIALLLPWPVPAGAFAVGLDPLSASFLLPGAALSPLAWVSWRGQAAS